jgi:K+-transporting ATPase KdpF subunit
MATILRRFWQKRIPKILLWALLGSVLSSVVIAPAVQASTGITLDRGQLFALVLLGITTVGLMVYLFVVIFKPERF